MADEIKRVSKTRARRQFTVLGDTFSRSFGLTGQALEHWRTLMAELEQRFEDTLAQYDPDSVYVRPPSSWGSGGIGGGGTTNPPTTTPANLTGTFTEREAKIEGEENIITGSAIRVSCTPAGVLLARLAHTRGDESRECNAICTSVLPNYRIKFVTGGTVRVLMRRPLTGTGRLYLSDVPGFFTDDLASNTTEDVQFWQALGRFNGFINQATGALGVADFSFSPASFFPASVGA